VPLLLGGVVLVLFALLSLSASGGAEAKKNVGNTILGALLVAALTFVLLRAGMAWLAVMVVLLYSAFKSYWARARSARPPDSSAPPRSSSAGPSSRAAPRIAGEMSRDEAYAVLGLSPGASKDAVVEAYKRLMKKLHPDTGGSTYLAQRINEAREVLLGR
jgi:DnaJ family protein C protein 19